MRLPLAINFESRDGTASKDAGVKNAFIEVEGESSAILKRPGAASLGSAGTGAGQLLACYNGQLRSIIGNTLADLAITTEISSDPAILPSTGAYKTYANVAYGGGKFVAISNENTDPLCATSNDGITWTGRGRISRSENNEAIISIAYGNGLFFAISADTFNDPVLISSDFGVTWGEGAQYMTTEICERVIFANGYFYIMDARSDLLRSADGVSKETVYIDTMVDTGSNDILDSYVGEGHTQIGLCFFKSVYYSLKKRDSDNVLRLASSTNLIDWVSIDLPYAVGYDTVCLVNDGVNIAIPGHGYSSNGVNWYASSGLNTGSHVVGCEVSNSLWVAAAYVSPTSEDVYMSNDHGATWSKVETLATFSYGSYGGDSIAADASGNFYSGNVEKDKINRIYPVSSGAGGDVVEVQASEAIASIDPSLAFFAEVSGQAQSQNVILLKNGKEAWIYS